MLYSGNRYDILVSDMRFSSGLGHSDAYNFVYRRSFVSFDKSLLNDT